MRMYRDPLRNLCGQQRGCLESKATYSQLEIDGVPGARGQALRVLTAACLLSAQRSLLKLVAVNARG
jgi:hypothetical protein